MIKYVIIRHILNERGETIASWYCVRYNSAKLIVRRELPKTVEKWISEHKFNHYECTYPVMHGKVFKVEFMK